MKFPNKMLNSTYHKALGHTFTYSPSNQVFTDENNCSDYNYSAMLWLLHNKLLQVLDWDSKSIAFKYKVKEVA